MQFVVFAGAGLSCLGIGLLIWCMLRANRLRGSDPAEAEPALRSLILLNMAGVGLGFFGLAIVIAGLLLG
ncbi:MAG: hypothetical protein AAGC79_02790 [Pseudomonadota bacterium]